MPRLLETLWFPKASTVSGAAELTAAFMGLCLSGRSFQLHPQHPVHAWLQCRGEAAGVAESFGPYRGRWGKSCTHSPSAPDNGSWVCCCFSKARVSCAESQLLRLLCHQLTALPHQCKCLSQSQAAFLAFLVSSAALWIMVPAQG